MKLFKRIWCYFTHTGNQCAYCMLVPPKITVELAPFDWLTDYGPYWEPGDAAFWLEPKTHRQLADWYAKYRPEFRGIAEAAGIRIEIVAPVQRTGKQLHAAAQEYQNLHGLTNAAGYVYPEYLRQVYPYSTGIINNLLGQN